MTVVRRQELEYLERPGRRAADPFAGLPLGGSSARQVTLAFDPNRGPHRHPESEEVIYVADGDGQVWIDGTFHPVTAGSWVRVLRGAPHATVPDAGSTMSLICFFPHPDLDRNIEELDGLIEEGGDA